MNYIHCYNLNLIFTAAFG